MKLWSNILGYFQSQASTCKQPSNSCLKVPDLLEVTTEIRIKYVLYHYKWIRSSAGKGSSCLLMPFVSQMSKGSKLGSKLLHFGLRNFSFPCSHVYAGCKKRKEGNKKIPIQIEIFLFPSFLLIYILNIY